MMSLQAKRELLAQVAPRYHEASHGQKSVILDEFVAATGYQRKYAIWLLSQPVPAPSSIHRPRPRRYHQVVQDALVVAWTAANFICAKRLVPFLPELVPTLEHHGHLQLTDDARELLLAMSVSTAERLLAPVRRESLPRGATTTKPGALLKRQIPIRTFNDWNETSPGFFEVDSVAHCGGSLEGEFLFTLTLTDVATGWTECLVLLHRSQPAVVQAIKRVRQLLPFPLLGIDSDNGSEFINAELLAYCQREHLDFTRGRVAKKNDQCYVEQKNGAVVRQYVGYDRFEGERAYRQMVELYRALRLYVNFFQPSMKLCSKQREGSKVQRKYDAAQTPLQRLLTSDILPLETQERLRSIYRSLDPVRLLHQIEILQDALWKLAIAPTANTSSPFDAQTGPSDPARFNREACGLKEGDSVGSASSSDLVAATTPSVISEHRTRRYHRRQLTPVPHTWRTRPDPFEQVWDEVSQWLGSNPERTAKSILLELQQRYPERFPDGQLRTLQRRVRQWRAHAILTFDEQWLQEEILREQLFPRPLQAVPQGGPA